MAKFRLLVLHLASMIGSIGVVFAADTKIPIKVIVNKNIKHDVSIPLHLMPRSKFIGIPSSIDKTEVALSELIQLSGFQGLGVGFGNYQVTHARPDISMSVGMSHIVEWVNNDIVIFTKDGQVVPGFPKPGSSVWAGFGGDCEFHSNGSPIVRYDQLAHRWVLSQHAFNDMNTGPFYQCVAVSTSEDAAGSYYRYAFEFSTFSEYAKLGLWPDAYYLSLNMRGRVSLGPQFCALERDKMLNGLDAAGQCIQLSAEESGPAIPSDLVGTAMPPAGAPEYFMSLSPPGQLLFHKFHVNFTNPSETELTFTTVPVQSYLLACPNSAGAECAIQPNTSNRLDVTSDRVMGRLVYRQFADYGVLLGTHTVEGAPNKFAPAPRWYEFRVLRSSPSYNPIVYQSATLAPDSKNRFLGAITNDKFGNIALGYNVTSSLIYPSIEMGWRKFADPLNTLTIQPLVTGRGSQLDSPSWGRFSSMVIDPSDECTFWYANQYIKQTGAMNWSTYITRFTLGSCDNQ